MIQKVVNQHFLLHIALQQKLTTISTKITDCYNKKIMCMYQLKSGWAKYLPQICWQQKQPTNSTKHTSDDNNKNIWLQHLEKST